MEAAVSPYRRSAAPRTEVRRGLPRWQRACLGAATGAVGTLALIGIAWLVVLAWFELVAWADTCWGFPGVFGAVTFPVAVVVGGFIGAELAVESR